MNADLCKKTLDEISNLNVKTGLPKHFVIISVAAYDNLKYGIPKDFTLIHFLNEDIK